MEKLPGLLPTNRSRRSLRAHDTTERHGTKHRRQLYQLLPETQEEITERAPDARRGSRLTVAQSLRGSKPPASAGAQALR